MSTLASLIDQVRRISNRDNVTALRECVINSDNWLKTAFNNQNTVALVEGRSAFVDALLKHCWHLYELDKQPDLTLIAVGGYGRGQLHPYSDVDILILYKKKLSPEAEESIKSLITLLWDIRLDLGQSVRSVKESMKQANADITIATNILESRLLAGCSSTFEQLKSDIHSDKFWSSKDYYLAKLQEQQNRHLKFHGTAYNLEPNLKENPGGLRDIQTTTWVAKKHFNVMTGAELVEKGYLEPDELQELLECRDFLWQVRFALHVKVGRNENRLLFDHQPEVAKAMGYGEGKKAVETLMKAFFRVVRRIIELNEMLLQHFDNDLLDANKKHSTSKIDEDYCIQQKLIKAKKSTIFDSPESILKFFLVIAENEKVTGIHSDTLRLLRLARRKFSDGYLSDYGPCRELFMQLVRHPNFFGLAWDLMHKHGVMQAYMSQWDHIVGLMQFDMFHAYTVDEHTHRLIKNIYRYTHPTAEQMFPRCSRIMRYAAKPELLYLAAIFHDISKGKGGDHSELGELEALIFARQHGLSREDGEMVAWLVRSHLMMSVIAQRRDIYDPEVIKDFAERVEDEEKLNFLYALTSADIRATNDSLWNEWKSSLLRDTFLFTKDFLRNEGEFNDNQAKALSNKRQALELLQGNGFSQEQVNSLWSTFDDHYFVRNRPAHIVWQTQSALMCDNNMSVVVSNKVYRGGTAVLVYCKDSVGLFAQISSVLDNKKYSIHDAQIMCTSDGMVLDTIIVADSSGCVITSEAALNSLQKTISKQITEKALPKVKRRTSRQIKQFNIPTKVTFLPVRNDQTRLEISTLDTPGLLARITGLFARSEYHLHAAKVSTIGEKAEDFFVISNSEFKQLEESECQQLRQQLIAELDLHNNEHVKA